jgi:hypothetical protein
MAAAEMAAGRAAGARQEAARAAGATVAEQTAEGSEVVLKAVAPAEVQTGLEMEAAAEEEAGEAARPEVELRAAATMAAEWALLLEAMEREKVVVAALRGRQHPQQPVCRRSACRRCRTCTTCLRCKGQPGRICPCTGWLSRRSWYMRMNTKRKSRTAGTPGRCIDLEPRRYFRRSTCYTQCCRTPCKFHQAAAAETAMVEAATGAATAASCCTHAPARARTSRRLPCKCSCVSHQCRTCGRGGTARASGRRSCPRRSGTCCTSRPLTNAPRPAQMS